MTATYTFDVFSSLDGFGSVSGGDWGGYWGKQGPRPDHQPCGHTATRQRSTRDPSAHHVAIDKAEIGCATFPAGSRLPLAKASVPTNGQICSRMCSHVGTRVRQVAQGPVKSRLAAQGVL